MRMRVSILAAVLLVAACQSSTPPESPSEPGPSASASEVPSVAPSASAAAEPGWEVVTFAGAGGPAIAREVAAFEGGFVAVGVAFDEPLPDLGPTPPHEGRIWFSEDGTSWEDVTPSAELVNVHLDDLYVRGDGTLVAIGLASTPFDFGVEPVGRAVWESTDGLSWASAAGPILGAQSNVEAGEQGYLALAYPGLDNSSPSLVFSADGVAWNPVRDLPDGSFDLDAGDEGFVVVGDIRGPLDVEPVPYVVASGDGEEWVSSSDPPEGIPSVGALGSDWVLTAWDFSSAVPIWTSMNGLDWSMSGSVQLEEVVVDAQTTLGAFPAGLVSSGSTLVLATTLYREGTFVVHGTEHISPDGITWDALPFPPSTVGVQDSGSRVEGAVDADGFLLLVGQQNGEAAFWTGPLD
jgi:hypothetical protein